MRTGGMAPTCLCAPAQTRDGRDGLWRGGVGDDVEEVGRRLECQGLALGGESSGAAQAGRSRVDGAGRDDGALEPAVELTLAHAGVATVGAEGPLGVVSKPGRERELARRELRLRELLEHRNPSTQ
jgi:hypothetical protein